MKKNPFKNLTLDSYEQEIEDALEKGEYRISPHQDTVKKDLVASARYTLDRLKKDKNINIRLQHKTLAIIKDKALEEGLPYQTLIGSILHKYVTGRLVSAP